MKKLLMLAAIAAFAGAAQAATLSWMMSANKLPSGDNGAGFATLLFVTSQSQNFGADVTTKNDVIALLDNGPVTFTTETDSNGKTKVTAISDGTTTIKNAAYGETNANGGLTGATNYGAGNWTTGDSLSAFVVMFNNAVDAANLNYVVSDSKDVSWNGPGGAQTLRFGTVAPANATWKPVAVPEPATATLALAGLALLLKRRRA